MAELMRIYELARMLKISQAWLFKEVQEGRLPYLKAGRAILLNPEAVQETLLLRASETRDKNKIIYLESLDLPNRVKENCAKANITTLEDLTKYSSHQLELDSRLRRWVRELLFAHDLSFKDDKWFFNYCPKCGAGPRELCKTKTNHRLSLNQPHRTRYPFNENERKRFKKLGKTINELHLSARVENRLDYAGIKYVGDLVKKSKYDLLKIKSFGRKSIREVEEILASMEIYLRK